MLHPQMLTAGPCAPARPVLPSPPAQARGPTQGRQPQRTGGVARLRRGRRGRAYPSCFSRCFLFPLVWRSVFFFGCLFISIHQCRCPPFNILPSSFGRYLTTLSFPQLVPTPVSPTAGGPVAPRVSQQHPSRQIMSSFFSGSSSSFKSSSSSFSSFSSAFTSLPNAAVGNLDPRRPSNDETAGVLGQRYAVARGLVSETSGEFVSADEERRFLSAVRRLEAGLVHKVRQTGSGHNLLADGLDARPAEWRLWWGPIHGTAVLLTCQALFLVGLPSPPEGGSSWVEPWGAASVWSRIKLGVLMLNTALAAAPITHAPRSLCRALAARLGDAYRSPSASLAVGCLAAAGVLGGVSLAFLAEGHFGGGFGVNLALCGMMAAWLVVASAGAGLSDVGRSGLMHLSFFLASTALAYIYPSGWLIAGLSIGSLCPAIFVPPARTVRGLRVGAAVGLIGFYAVLDAASRREGLAPSNFMLRFFSGFAAYQASYSLRQVPTCYSPSCFPWGFLPSRSCALPSFARSVSLPSGLGSHSRVPLRLMEVLSSALSDGVLAVDGRSEVRVSSTLFG